MQASGGCNVQNERSLGLVFVEKRQDAIHHRVGLVNRCLIRCQPRRRGPGVRSDRNAITHALGRIVGVARHSAAADRGGRQQADDPAKLCKVRRDYVCKVRHKDLPHTTIYVRTARSNGRPPRKGQPSACARPDKDASVGCEKGTEV